MKNDVNYNFNMTEECVDEKIAVMRKRSRHGGKETMFDSTKFRLKYVLGSGSFGVVTYAEYSDVITGKLTNFALKSLSKAAVVETGMRDNFYYQKNGTYFLFPVTNYELFMILQSPS